MKAAAVVGFKVDPEALLCLSAIAISVQIHLLVLDRASFCGAPQNGATADPLRSTLGNGAFPNARHARIHHQSSRSTSPGCTGHIPFFMSMSTSGQWEILVALNRFDIAIRDVNPFVCQISATTSSLLSQPAVCTRPPARNRRMSSGVSQGGFFLRALSSRKAATARFSLRSTRSITKSSG